MTNNWRPSTPPKQQERQQQQQERQRHRVAARYKGCPAARPNGAGDDAGAQPRRGIGPVVSLRYGAEAVGSEGRSVGAKEPFQTTVKTPIASVKTMEWVA